MHICFLNGTGLQYDRGSSNYLAYLLPVLADKGVSGHFFTPFSAQQNIDDALKSVYVPCDNAIDADTDIEYINKQIDIALEYDYDLIHIHSIPAALRISDFKKKGVQVIVTHHGSGLYSSQHPDQASRLVYESYLSVLKNADELIVHSPIIQSAWRQKHDLESKIFFLGVPLTNPEKPTIIQQPPYSLKEKEYFLFLGKLKDEKGPDLAIKAYARSKLELPLVIAGPARFEEKYAQALHDIYGNGGRVLFTGTVVDKIKSELLSNALATINPLKIKGLPLVTLESMSYGTPVISSDSAIHHQVIRETVLFKSEDVADLTQKMIDAVKNPELMIVQGEKQQAFVKKFHNVNVLADLYIDSYDSILKK